MNPIKLNQIAFISLFATAASHAATIVSYDFGTAAAATNAGNALAGVTASTFIGSEDNVGAGLGGTRATFSTGNVNAYGHSSATVGSIAGTPAGDLTTEISGTTDRSLTVTGANAHVTGTTVGLLAFAMTNDNYLEFSVDAGADSIDLQTLSFLSSRNHAARAIDGFSLFVSTDDFVTAPIAANALNVINGTTVQTFNEFSFDLSSFATTDDELTFRIYLYGKTNSNNNSGAANFDNFVLTGDVIPVPEPSSTALLGLGGLALLLRRRK